MQDLKKTKENVLWLNAGDFCQGTIWYTQFKWEVVSKFNNLLEFDAMTLGNHEVGFVGPAFLLFLRHFYCQV